MVFPIPAVHRPPTERDGEGLVALPAPGSNPFWSHGRPPALPSGSSRPRCRRKQQPNAAGGVGGSPHPHPPGAAGAGAARAAKFSKD